MKLLSFWLSILCAYCVVAVNRDNFKTCVTSSFCNRQRGMSPNTTLYQVLPESVVVNEYSLKANLSRSIGDQILSLEITYLGFSTFRVIVDEPDALWTRYRLGTKDALKGPLKALHISAVKSPNSIKLIGSPNDTAVLFYNPFYINFNLDGVVVSQFNRRGLFNFELAELPSHPDEPKTENATESEVEKERVESEVEKEPVELPPATEPDAPKPDNTESLDQPSAEASNEETQKVEETTPAPPDPFPWAENFKEHRDTRPHGPNSISLDIDFPGFSHMYGIPEHADSFTLRPTSEGDPYRMYNLDVFEYELNNPMALYGSVPFLWAVNTNHTVGIFWHNPSETWIDIEYIARPSDGLFSKIPMLFARSPEERYSNSRWISETGVLDVFVMMGRESKDVSNAYAHLTGTTPLPPLFALAYHQCRWNYKDEADVMGIDQKFDEHGIPVDVIWLDIDHTNGKRYFTWDQPKFPSPGEMVDKLLTKGRKLVTVVDPHIKQDSSWEIYQKGVENNFFIKTREGTDFIGWCWPGSSAWPDFTAERVQRWWAELFLTYEPVRIDTMYSWNDMGEPSVFSGPEITIHKDTIHAGDREHRDLHNAYGMFVHKATWDGQLLRSEGKERPFVLTRAFFAGSQRTSAVWTGDNTANWEHLKISIPMALSLSLTGITFCGADVGGFFGNTEPELLTRWYQAAAFQPFFRAHKHMDTKRHEPWLFDAEYRDVIRDAIIARYQLLPYWYTLFARAEVDGQPPMAPIWYHFREIESTYTIEHEYMVGEAILVCPVTKPGATSVDVYFPPGVWYHHTSFETFNGGWQIRIPVELQTIPVFYRGGYIIPRRDRVRRSSWLMRYDPLTLFVMLDPELNYSQGYLYDDDYHSVSRESAHFYRIEFRGHVDPTSHTPAGGVLRVETLPVPGQQQHNNGTSSQSHLVLERIVFIGLQQPLERITLIRNSGERHNVQFDQSPTKTADAQYHGQRQTGFAVVRCPGLSISPDWQLHLVTGTELKAEL